MKPFTLEMYIVYKTVIPKYDMLSELYDDIVYSENQLGWDSTEYDRRDIRFMKMLLEEHIKLSEFRLARLYVDSLID